MSNITLSIDDETIKQARLRAVQEGTSLSAKMREYLQRYASGQAESAGPDLSFAENALMFTQQPQEGLTSRAAEAQQPAPLAANGMSVDPAYLRKLRGWAREDVYDRSSPPGNRPSDLP